MRAALRLPDHVSTSGDEFTAPGALAEVALAAEAAGFDAVFVSDHPIPSADVARLGEHHTYDPFVTLAYLAGVTTRLRLMTAATVPVYRNPFVTAKAVATLDVLSGGRVVLGVGAGYMRDEFAALGVDFDERNELLDEALDVIRLAWAGQPLTHRGRHFHARGNHALLTPVQKPHPPIWVGGNSRRAIRRAAEKADGWMPFPISRARAPVDATASMNGHEDLAAGIAYARRCAAERDPGRRFDVAYMPLPREALVQPDPDRYLADARRLAQLGVSYFVTQLPMTSRREVVNAIATFGDQVLPGVTAISEPDVLGRPNI